jgi:hypothetical protein
MQSLRHRLQHHAASPRRAFFGPWVVRATFVMALFGWGVGFYGPPVFLHAVMQRTGWPLTLVSSAVTLHYLSGALLVTRLPRLHQRFGVGPTAAGGSVCVLLGMLGWSTATAPWQLLASALFSGAWITMGAVAVNAAIAPWHVRARPMALAKAYNGASVGGVLFSPLWVLLIGQCGFTAAAGMVGLVMVMVMATLSGVVFSKTPERLGQRADGEAADAAPDAAIPAVASAALPGGLLWRDRRFRTLALGMAAGLFAQIGLMAHLFSLLVPMYGTQAAGLAIGFATACAIGGRLLFARLLATGADRRAAAALGYAVQLAGTAILMMAADRHPGWTLLGLALFGSGLGNATSLPPLIAQAEFAKVDVPRVVALVVAMAQAAYAFAPAVFGLALSGWSKRAPHAGGEGALAFFLASAVAQGLAIGCFLSGRRAA